MSCYIHTIFPTIVKMSRLRTCLLKRLTLTLILACCAISEVRAECLVKDVAYHRRTPSTVDLDWQTTCEGVIKYKVYLTHSRYKACGSDEVGDSVVLESDHSGIRLENLKAYSEYSVQIVALLPRNGEAAQSEIVEFETLEGVPQVRPEKSSSKSLSLGQGIKFFWKSPQGIDVCQRRNGKLDGEHVELFALDPWGQSEVPSKPVETAKVEEGVNFYLAENLMAYTRYFLQVFSQNADGQWNPALSLKLEGQTLPTTPLPPENLEATPDVVSVHLKWRPAYPPTGKVKKYVVRYGLVRHDNKTRWINSYDVRGDMQCAQFDGRTTTELDGEWWQKDICTVIDKLTPSSTYQFEVQTVNEDVQDVDDTSEAVSVTTTLLRDPFDASKTSPIVDVTTTTPPPTRLVKGDGDDDDSTNNVLVVVLSLTSAILLLMICCFVLFYKIRVSKIKSSFYEQHQDGFQLTPTNTDVTIIDQMRSTPGRANGNDNANSSYLTGVSMLTDTSMLSNGSGRYLSDFHVDEIQRRRLPEPPPLASSPNIRRDTHVYEDADAAMAKEEAALKRHRQVMSNSLGDVTAGEEDTTDVDGYLRPTFVPAAPSPEPPLAVETSVSSPQPDLIPVASYMTSTPKPTINIQGQMQSSLV